MERHREAELHIAARQADAALKIVQASAVDPWIVLGPVGETLLVNLRCEQLSERGAHGLRPRRHARKIYVSVDGEAYARQHIRQALDPLARKPNSFREPQPRFDAARIVAVSIMVENALHPVPAHCSVGAIRENGSILDGNVDLVIEAIRDPCANLLRPRTARIQHDIEGVMDMICGAFVAQLPFELFARPRTDGHSTISMPS